MRGSTMPRVYSTTLFSADLPTSRQSWRLLLSLALVILSINLRAQQMTLSRKEATIMVEAYAPNIVRVSLSLRKEDATRAPGYGITAKPLTGGWKRETSAAGDVLSSSRLVVTVSPEQTRSGP